MEEDESWGHAWQSPMLVCAISSWYVFFGHDKHTLTPAPMDGEYCPRRQSLHTADPNVILYFPATHFVHVSPSPPVEPALQIQSVSFMLASGAYEFVGHS